MSENLLQDVGEVLSVGGGEGSKEYTGISPIQVNNTTNKISIDESALTGKDWSTEIISATSGKADKTEIPSLDGYVTVSDLDFKLTNNGNIAVISGKPLYAVNALKDSYGNTISATYAKKSELPKNVSDLTNDTGFITSDSLEDYALKSDIPSLDGYLQYSDLTLNNDYVTAISGKGLFAYKAWKDSANQVITATYATKNELGNKQDSLTFGYTENKISTINGSALYGQGEITGTGEYIAGQYIEITDNNVINSTGLQPSLNNTQLNNINNAVTSTAGLASEQWVENKNYLTAVDDSNFVHKTGNESVSGEKIIHSVRVKNLGNTSGHTYFRVYPNEESTHSAHYLEIAYQFGGNRYLYDRKLSRRILGCEADADQWYFSGFASSANNVCWSETETIQDTERYIGTGPTAWTTGTSAWQYINGTSDFTYNSLNKRLKVENISATTLNGTDVTGYVKKSDYDELYNKLIELSGKITSPWTLSAGAGIRLVNDEENKVTIIYGE